MLQQPNESEPVPTLPRPELNPLLNPLLSKNLGRWAEVYLTSPPEGREQAVSDLLHELEAECDRKSDGAHSTRETDHQCDSGVASSVTTPDPLVRCTTCGHENALINQFCGMCGAKMQPESPQPESRWDKEFPTDDLSLFRSLSAASLDQTVGSRSRSYRPYAAALLALVLLALGYVVWRSKQTSPNAGQLPAVPAGASNSPASVPVELSVSRSQPTPATKNPAESTPPVSAETASKARIPDQTTPAKVQLDLAAKSLAATRTHTSEDNGDEELAEARRYLNGADGQPRDAAEASRLLWQAMAKDNAEASLLLADLYLKGDGVPKNCDQARVILSVAAHKDVPGAAERLRDVPASGCQ